MIQLYIKIADMQTLGNRLRWPLKLFYKTESKYNASYHSLRSILEFPIGLDLIEVLVELTPSDEQMVLL